MSEPRWATAFMRWLDLQPAVVELGELRLEQASGRYSLGHRAPQQPRLITLDELPALVRHDAEGNYRALPTAPTLRRDWRLEGLDADALVAALELIYPAALALWHAEQQGTLRVVDWSEVARRQTGWQGLVKRVGAADLGLAITLRCGAQGCVRRVLWNVAPDEPPPVAPGDGWIPCPEPCSVLVSLIRRIGQLERGDEEEADDPVWLALLAAREQA